MNQQVVYQDISQIHPYENNPRNNEAAVGPVAQSIKEFGFRVPILIDGKPKRPLSLLRRASSGLASVSPSSLTEKEPSSQDTPAMRPQNGLAWTKCRVFGSMT